MSKSDWAHARPLINRADGPRFEYLWQDSENFKRPTKMPAPEYIEHLMTWVQSNIDDEKIFPSRIGKLA
jgi:Mob1/phocein family